MLTLSSVNLLSVIGSLVGADCKTSLVIKDSATSSFITSRDYKRNRNYIPMKLNSQKEETFFTFYQEIKMEDENIVQIDIIFFISNVGTIFEQKR